MINKRLFHLTCFSVFTVDDNKTVLAQGVLIISCAEWSLYRVVFSQLWQTQLLFQDLHRPGLGRCLTRYLWGVILRCSSATTGVTFNLFCAVLSYNFPPLIYYKNEITWRGSPHLSLYPVSVSCSNCSRPIMCFAVARNSFSLLPWICFSVLIHQQPCKSFPVCVYTSSPDAW